MKQRILEILGRARAELDQAARELELEIGESVDSENEDEDRFEIQERMKALEIRVAAIEERVLQ